MDKYDLYGSVAYPKHHNQEDVGDIYRYAAETNGVFGAPASGASTNSWGRLGG